MLQVHRALKDILAGGVFIALGLAFGIGSLSYDIGTPLRMGPGYVPLVLGGLLAALGAAIVVEAFSVRKLIDIPSSEIERRVTRFREITAFETHVGSVVGS